MARYNTGETVLVYRGFEGPDYMGKVKRIVDPSDNNALYEVSFLFPLTHT